MKVFSFRASSTNLIIPILRLSHFPPNLIKLSLVFLDFLANEITLSPILGVLRALHEIHRFNFHLFKQVLGLGVFFGVAVDLQILRKSFLILEQQFHSINLLYVFAFVAVEEIQRHLLSFFQIYYYN